MPMPPWQGSKVKVYLRLASQRLHTLLEKKENLAKAARRDIATLIERNKIETARIRVEAIIHDDLYIELLEILELYTELLHTRFPLLDSSMNSKTRALDPKVKEAAISIVYAADTTEVKELKFVRESIMNRLGRDWAIEVMENRDNCVSPRVLTKVVTDTPSPELVDAYLEEIARGYGLPWTSTRKTQDVPEATIPTVEGLTTVDDKVNKSGAMDASGSGENEHPVDPNGTIGPGDTKFADIKHPSGPGHSSTEDPLKYTPSDIQAPKVDKGKAQYTPRSILRSDASRLVRTPSPHSLKEAPPSYMSPKPVPPAIEDDDDDDDELLRRFAALKGGRP